MYPAKLNATCDPETESFMLSALLEFGSAEGSYLCPIFLGLSPLRLDYGTDFLVTKQGEPIVTLKAYVSEPIDRCKSSPNMPLVLVLDESNCSISGAPRAGLNSTKFMITSSYRTKQTTFPLVIKSLFIPKFAFVENIG